MWQRPLSPHVRQMASRVACLRSAANFTRLSGSAKGEQRREAARLGEQVWETDSTRDATLSPLAPLPRHSSCHTLLKSAGELSP